MDHPGPPDSEQSDARDERKVAVGQESPGSYTGPREAPHTVSSYSGIFNRVGLPLPRSARVKVDYELAQRDPKISE